MIAIIIVAVVVVFGLLVYLFSRGEGATPELGDSRIQTRNDDDGFFIEGSLPHGTNVRYEALVRGSWHRGIVLVTGAETFVYTGTPPTEVRIVDVIEPNDALPPSSGPSGPPSSAPSDVPFAGFPSAY